MLMSKRLEEKNRILNTFLEGKPQYEELVKVFKKFLHKKNESRCEIYVGKRNNDCFQSYLSTIANNYNVILSNYQDEPQYIIKDYRGNTLVAINLSLVKNIHIDTTEYEDENTYVYDYKIDFAYNLGDFEVDYHMHFYNTNLCKT